MSRSFTCLRRALFGTSCVVVFGFGATEALGSAARVEGDLCEPRGYDYPEVACGAGCYNWIGYCDSAGACHCGEIP